MHAASAADLDANAMLTTLAGGKFRTTHLSTAGHKDKLTPRWVLIKMRKRFPLVA